MQRKGRDGIEPGRRCKPTPLARVCMRIDIQSETPRTVQLLHDREARRDTGVIYGAWGVVAAVEVGSPCVGPVMAMVDT